MKFIGLDWKDKGYTVSIIDEEGNNLSVSFDIEKNPHGFSSLVEEINNYSSGYKDVLIGIEEAREPIVDYLLTLGYTVYLIPPNMIKSLRKRHSGSGSHSDETDSYVIADAVRTDRSRLEVIEKKDDKVKETELLYRQLKVLDKDKNRLLNRLQSFLKEYFPVFLDFFNDVGCSTALAFLKKYPTFEDVKKLSKEEIRNFLQDHNCYLDSVLNKIFRAINRKQMEINPVIIKTRKESIVYLANQLELINQEQRDYQRKLKGILGREMDAEIFKSLPAAGEKTVPGLFIIFGKDRDRYEKAEGINALSGMVPVTKSSGNWKDHFFRFGCNRLYRNIITLWANASLNESEWARSYYNKKRAEGKSHYHALRCLGRLWIKVAFALWKKREKYNEDKHMAAVQKHRIRNELARKSA